MNPYLRNASLGISLLLTYLTGVNANATEYFPKLTADEKDEFTNFVNDRSSSYPRHSFLPSAEDPEDGVAVFWKLDEDKVHFAVAARAEGWLGVGVSEAGGMIGSDVALFETSKPSELADTHIVADYAKPITDDCQDWILEGTPSKGENGWIIIEMSRLLDTNDTQDHAIRNDAELWSAPTRLIAAWGDDAVASYHGLKKSRSSVRLFAIHPNSMTDEDIMLGLLEEGSDGHFDFTEDDFEMPAEETYYHDLCRSAADLGINIPEGQDGLTMIGAVPIIDEDAAKHVHHFTVYTQKDCTDQSFLTRSMVYAWAPGDSGFALPNNVGFPVFNGEHNMAIHIQIHYDNPELLSGVKDSSGMRFYYTNEERTHRAGVFEVGDPYVALYGEEIPDGLTEYTFECPGACSSNVLATERLRANQGVTVLAEFLHMHQTGVHMANEVIRNGKVVHKAVSDVWDFDQQGVFQVAQDSYQIMPGDGFKTTCHFRDGMRFGAASSEEMCIAYIMYYPAKSTSFNQAWSCPHKPFKTFGTGCETSLQYKTLSSDDELGRMFGESSAGMCDIESGAGDSSNSNDTPAETPTTNDFPAETSTTGDLSSGSDSIGVTVVSVVSVLMVAMVV